jgi:hypothetical protein
LPGFFKPKGVFPLWAFLFYRHRVYRELKKTFSLMSGH